MIKLVVPAAAVAFGAGAFFFMKHRHKTEEDERRLDAELAAAGYPGE